MAPPLLPRTRLVACIACAQHFKSSESVCPHCGAEPQAESRMMRAAATVLVGLALSGCPEKEPDTTSDSGSGTSTGDTGSSTTGGETEGDESTTGSMPEPEYGVPVTTGSSAEPDYGVPATESAGPTSESATGDTDAGTSTGDTDVTTSGGEPLYGAGAS